jgi:protoporphyrinogen oxidase
MAVLQSGVMNVAIIGGGFTGLAAAYALTKQGQKVTLFEKEATLGGLAHGFKQPNWEWHLEYAYHHWFTNDTAVLALVRELGLQDTLLTLRPITATLWHEKKYQLDSAASLLAFPGIPFIDRVRTGALLAALKLNPFWQPLEGITAKQLFLTIGGRAAWNTIWEPLMTGKFGLYAQRVQAAWLWARVKKRTPSLGYIQGGFHALVGALEKAIKQNGGKIRTGQPAPSYPTLKHQFDKVLLTVPTPIAARIVDLPKDYIAPLLSIPHLHAQTLILETDKPILKDVYWLNITDRTFPFLAVVAHTNFVNKKNYGGRHITYFGNYLPPDHPYLSMTKEQLLKKFMPFIKRLNPAMNSRRITNSYLFTGPFAQPVHQLRYSRKIPPIATPTSGVYLANMDFVVPWDRGTNYAVELGLKAAKLINENANEFF